jgi:hypothetical protein
MTPFRIVVIVSQLLIILAVVPAAGQELITNGDFDTDLSNWFHTPETLGSSIAWDPMDVDGFATSGSARVGLDPAAAGNSFSMNQCVEVSEALLYEVGAWVFLPSTAPLGETFVRVQWYDAPACDGNFLGSTDITTFEIVDVWLDVSDVDIAPLTGAQSARLFLTMIEDGSSSDHHVAYWDDVHFVPEPSGFLGAGVIFLTMVARRRRR